MKLTKTLQLLFTLTAFSGSPEQAEARRSIIEVAQATLICGEYTVHLFGGGDDEKTTVYHRGTPVAEWGSAEGSSGKNGYRIEATDRANYLRVGNRRIACRRG